MWSLPALRSFVDNKAFRKQYSLLRNFFESNFGMDFDITKVHAMNVILDTARKLAWRCGHTERQPFCVSKCTSSVFFPFPILPENAVFATDFVYKTRFGRVGILLLFRALEEAFGSYFCFESDFGLLLS